VPLDVIVSTDSVAVAAAKDVTSTIPIVLQGTGNPVPAKLVTSLDRPGGNGRQAFLATNKDRIVQLAAGTGLPAMYSTRELVAAGGLMGYGASEEAIAQRTAGVVDRILKGANPAEMPIEQATSFELVVNIKTAQALGLMIPRSVLNQATEIIQ